MPIYTHREIETDNKCKWKGPSLVLIKVKQINCS